MTAPGTALSANIQTHPYGAAPDGRPVTLYEVVHPATRRVMRLVDCGATMVSLDLPDRSGRFENVLLGRGLDRFDGDPRRRIGSPDGSWNPYFFGSTVGRYCNRIAGGRFVLRGRSGGGGEEGEGEEFVVATNDGRHHLHGGLAGFHTQMWEVGKVHDVRNGSGRDDTGGGGNCDRGDGADEGAPAVGITFRRTSPDGEEGYPGTLRVSATYAWTDRGDLSVAFRAETDRPTVVNLTNHNYWNLDGVGNRKGGDVRSHRVQIIADNYLPVDAESIPTGAIVAVDGTPFDLRSERKMGDAMDHLSERGDDSRGGYDHCFVLRGGGDGDGDAADGSEPDRSALPPLARAARVFSPSSGRIMEVYTTQPGLQFYTGNYLDGTTSEGCAGFPRHGGFCLETQHYPDSPNNNVGADAFPTTVLLPGEVFEERTVFRFSVGDS